MKFTRLYRVSVTAALFGIAALGIATTFAVSAQAQEFGDLSGQFVLDGEIPAVEKLDSTKEAICAPTIDSDELRVNKDNKGIANIFVYIPADKKPAMNPALKVPKTKEVVLNQEKCAFMPHAMFMRTDQLLLVKSKDSCNHNTRTSPINNTPINNLIAGVNDAGLPVKMPLAERYPTQIKCDIHGWMSAYCLVLNHPYVAVTDADGKFEIAGVPAGENEFRFWHERCGNIEKGIKITIKAGTNKIETYKVPADKLKKQN